MSKLRITFAVVIVLVLASCFPVIRSEASTTRIATDTSIKTTTKLIKNSWIKDEPPSCLIICENGHILLIEKVTINGKHITRKTYISDQYNNIVYKILSEENECLNQN